MRHENVTINNIEIAIPEEELMDDEITEIDFSIDDYNVGFDVYTRKGKVLRVRVGTWPGADTSFYLRK